jgi:beta propeller repeat protein
MIVAFGRWAEGLKRRTKMSTHNTWKNSRLFHLGLTLTFSLVLLLGLLSTMSTARSASSSDNNPLAQPPALHNNSLPDEYPVITNAASQQWLGISGDCVVFRDDRDGYWNVYLHNLSSGETFTVTSDEPELRKVVVSQGVVVWRSERAGAEGLWGYYDPTCSDAGPFTATTEIITPFQILYRGHSHAVALSGEMVTFDTWAPAGAWYVALMELDANDNGVPDATEPGYDPADESLLIRLSCCAGGPNVTFYQRLSDVYWDDDYRVACWTNNRTDGAKNELVCVDLHHYQDPPVWEHSFVVNNDTFIGPKDYGGIISIYRDLVVWTGSRDAAVSGYDLYIIDLDPDDDGVINTEGLQEFSLVDYPWDQEYPDVWGSKTPSNTWQIFAAWVDRRNGNQQDIYAYDLSLDSDGDGLSNWQDPDRFCIDPAEFPITLHTAAQTGPELWNNTIVWLDYRKDSDIYSATLQPVQPQPRVYITGTAQEKALYWLDRQTITFSEVQDIPGYILASNMITRYKSFTQAGAERVRKAWYSATVGSYVVGYDYCYYGTPDQKRYLGRSGRGFIYDQGLALIARTMLAQPTQAQALGNYVSSFQNSGQLSTTITGSLGFSFNGQGYWGEKDNFYDMDYLRTGANAWLGYGLLFYARQYSGAQFADTITRVADYILDHQVLDPADARYGLFTGGFGNWLDDEFQDQSIGWAATEHNIDVYFFLRDLGRMTGEDRYTAAADLLRANMPKLWDETKGRLNQGMSISGTLDTNDALDAASWGAIYWVAVGDLEKARRSLAYADSVYSNTVQVGLVSPTLSLSLWGYKPYSDTVDVVWSEGSLGVAMAYLKLGHALLDQCNSEGEAYIEKAQAIVGEMERLQALDPNGGLLYAISSSPVITDFPQAPSAAGTAWLLMVQRAVADEAMRDAFWGPDWADESTACLARLNDGNVYLDVQAAVDASTQYSDVVKVSGYCTGVNSYGGWSQAVYLSKTLTLRGGYTTTNWNMSNPISYPTTLDALRLGRVLYVAGNPFAGSGQAVTPTVAGLRITGGDASGLGGSTGGRDAGGGAYVVAAMATLSNNHVFSNTADRGGGLYFQNSHGTRLVDNLISVNHTPLGGSGGGLYFKDSANVALMSNTISSNEAALHWNWGYGGGAVFDNSPEAILSANIIHGNRATDGGGLNFYTSPGATLISNAISDNVADHTGGGMKNYAGVYFDHSDNATLISNTIRGNRTANTCGGVCFNSSHNAVLNGNDIVSNTRGPGWDGYGVGVYLNDSENISLVNNTISHNTGEYLDNLGTIWGGGLYIGNSNATLMSNTIRSNGATRGGGLYVDSNSIVTLTSNIVADNAVYHTHGAWHDGPKGTGGGLHLSDSTATLINTVIADNQVETAGAGLYAERSAITLTNSIIADNQITFTDKITGSGSGLYITSSAARLLHLTIVRNSGGDGNGVYITGISSNVAMTNTILVSHTVGITVTAGNTATLEAMLWGAGPWANGTDWGGAGNINTGTRNYWGHPGFVDPDAGDYHIGPRSAARDVGLDAGVSSDMDGDLRPLGPGPDIGADEYWPPGGFKYIYLPLVLQKAP